MTADLETAVILWIPPHSTVLQMTSNIANVPIAQDMADGMKGYRILWVGTVRQLLTKLEGANHD